MTTDDNRIGASPDRLIIGRPFTLEVKCPTIPTHLYYLTFGHVPEYIPQVQGQLYVAGKEYGERGDFISYNKRCPQFLTATERDDAYIAKLHEYVSRFCDELDEATERVKAIGTFQAFAEMVTPVDAERGDNIRRDPLMPADELAGMIENDMRPGEHHRMEA